MSGLKIETIITPSYNLKVKRIIDLRLSAYAPTFGKRGIVVCSDVPNTKKEDVSMEKVKIKKTFGAAQYLSVSITVVGKDGEAEISGICTGYNGWHHSDAIFLPPYSVLEKDALRSIRSGTAEAKICVAEKKHGEANQSEYNGQVKHFFQNDLDWNSDVIFGVAGFNCVLNDCEAEFLIEDSFRSMKEFTGEACFTVLLLERTDDKKCEAEIISGSINDSTLLADIFRQMTILLYELRIPIYGPLHIIIV